MVMVTLATDDADKMHSNVDVNPWAGWTLNVEKLNPIQGWPECRDGLSYAIFHVY